MPFTPAHAAAVRPLTRWGLPTSALVVGSMAPDFPYYVPGAHRVLPGHLTHSLLGIVTVDVALGLVGFVLWHALVAPLIVHAAPPAWRVRFTRIGQGGPPSPRAGEVAGASAAAGAGPSAGTAPGTAARAVAAPGRRPGGWLRTSALVVAALIVGSATHVAWDEFTHAGRLADTHLELFSREWGSMPGWLWAQYASGVVGSLVVAHWVAVRWRASARLARSRRASGRGGALRQAPPDTALAVFARVGVLAAAVLAIAVGVRAGLSSTSVSGAGFDAVTTGGAAGTAVLVPVAVAVRIAARVQARRQALRRLQGADEAESPSRPGEVPGRVPG